MNLDDFKSAWEDRQHDVDASIVDAVAQKVRRRSISFERKILVRDILELLAVAFIVPVFIGFFLQFDSPVVKAGSAIVVLAAIQIAVVLLTTRFHRRTRSDQSLFDFTGTELYRVEAQVWLLKHVASWYVAPIMLGCFLISWGRDPWEIAVINSLIFLAFSGFLIWLNRFAVRRKLMPLREELKNTLLSLDENFVVPEPKFEGFEKMRLYNIAVIIVVTLASLLWSGYQMLPAGELSIEEAREFASPLVEAECVDGLSVGIIDGQRQMTIHLGRANRSNRTPNDETLYEIGGITKLFTSLMLAEAAMDNPGLLEQPADSDITLPRYKDQVIKWIDLSTHRSGLPRLPENLAAEKSDNPYAMYDSTKAIEFLKDHQLRRPPGSERVYSNFAVSWLGHLLVRRKNATYEQVLSDQITHPLHMPDTVITMSKGQSARFATPHSEFGVETSSWEFADLPGAGGIRSTTADLMKFMDAQLDRPQSKLGKAMELAWKQHRAGDVGDFAMGLGWLIARDGQTRFHNGKTGGFHSSMFINRKLGVGVVVLANTGSGDEVDRLAELLVQRLAGMKVKPQKLSKAIKVDATAMARLEGRYELAPTFIFDVKVVDGRLMVGITNQPTHEVYAKSGTTWFYKVVDAELEFKLDETGPAKSLVLHQNGLRQTAKRIE